mgnify:CR=1 FL=1
MKEAQMVVDYMQKGEKNTPEDKETFLKYFEKAISKGFDPDTMLTKVGLANQTTMYKKETKAIGQLLQRTVMQKFGPENLNEHYYALAKSEAMALPPQLHQRIRRPPRFTLQHKHSLSYAISPHAAMPTACSSGTCAHPSFGISSPRAGMAEGSRRMMTHSRSSAILPAGSPLSASKSSRRSATACSPPSRIDSR